MRSSLIDGYPRYPSVCQQKSVYIDILTRHLNRHRRISLSIANATCANVKCQSPIMMCVPHVNTRQPVCLDCSVLPPNCNPTVMPSPAALELDVAAADMALFEMSKEAEQSFGDPRWRGEVFTNGWPKVCGSNHQTFPNACFLQVFNCIARRYIDLVSTGSCTGEFHDHFLSLSVWRWCGVSLYLFVVCLFVGGGGAQGGISQYYKSKDFQYIIYLLLYIFSYSINREHFIK